MAAGFAAPAVIQPIPNMRPPTAGNRPMSLHSDEPHLPFRPLAVWEWLDERPMLVLAAMVAAGPAVVLAIAIVFARL